VLRGLERDPARRYASAREMALALERAAPSVRPSEIASWVERVAAGRLAERASTLHAIERTADNDGDASTAVQRVAPFDRWDADVSAHTLPEGESGTRRNRAVAQDVNDERAPSRPSGTDGVRAPKAMKGVGRRALIGGAVFALLALLSAIAWTVSLRRAPASLRAPVAQLVQGVSLGAHTAVPSSLPPATTLVAPANAPASTTELALPTKTAPTNEKRRLRPPRKSTRPACDPPYSIDSAGRVLFKVECM
jgi:hypothetical protein